MSTRMEKRIWRRGVKRTEVGSERIMFGEFSISSVRNSNEACRVSSSSALERAMDTMAWMSDSN